MRLIYDNKVITLVAPFSWLDLLSLPPTRSLEMPLFFYWERMQIPYKYYADRLPPDSWRPEIIYPVPGSLEQLEILTPVWKAPPPLPTQAHRRIWLVLHQFAENRGDPEVHLLVQALDGQFRVHTVRRLPAWTAILYSRP